MADNAPTMAAEPKSESWFARTQFGRFFPMKWETVERMPERSFMLSFVPYMALKAFGLNYALYIFSLVWGCFDTAFALEETRFIKKLDYHSERKTLKIGLTLYMCYETIAAAADFRVLPTPLSKTINRLLENSGTTPFLAGSFLLVIADIIISCAEAYVAYEKLNVPCGWLTQSAEKYTYYLEKSQSNAELKNKAMVLAADIVARARWQYYQHPDDQIFILKMLENLSPKNTIFSQATDYLLTTPPATYLASELKTKDEKRDGIIQTRCQNNYDNTRLVIGIKTVAAFGLAGANIHSTGITHTWLASFFLLFFAAVGYYWRHQREDSAIQQEKAGRANAAVWARGCAPVPENRTKHHPAPGAQPRAPTQLSPYYNYPRSIFCYH